KSIAVFIPWAAGARRIVVARGERPSGHEARHAEMAQSRFGAPGNHHIGIIMSDEPRGIANRVGAGCASRGDSGARSSQTEEDRDISAGGIDHKPWHGERADSA